MSSAPANAKLIAAAKAARRFVAASRWTIVESHSHPPGRRLVTTVKDEAALQWIAEHDVVLKKLDDALCCALSGNDPPPLGNGANQR